MLPTEEQIREALTKVVDPEINFDIVNLGLVYAIERHEETGHINVRMTLTSPGCPYGPQLIGAAEAVLREMEGVQDGTVELTFVPPWDPRTMASDEVKDVLGIF